jgi:uncharacterized phage-like protein YoqJ
MRARQSACSFTGHRPGKLPWGSDESDPRCVDLKRRIRDAVESAYAQGYRHFLSGMAMGCDLYFCECALALRAKHPEVTVEAAIPCPAQSGDWPEEERTRYRALVSACDYETLVSARYSPECMQRRNRYLVDHASLLIAAYDGTPGGTQYTIQYAMRRGIPVVDLAVLPRERI